MEYPGLSQPVVEFRTKKVPEYVAGAAGRLSIGIGLDGSVVNATSGRPAALAAAFQSIRY